MNAKAIRGRFPTTERKVGLGLPGYKESGEDFGS